VILKSGTEPTYPIDINTICALSIGIEGDISFDYNTMEIFQMGINVPKDYLLDRNIDGADSFIFISGIKTE
jgi:hypothetical protein